MIKRKAEIVYLIMKINDTSEHSNVCLSFETKFNVLLNAFVNKGEDALCCL